MSIISDYDDIGKRYRALSHGWVPREAATITSISITGTKDGPVVTGIQIPKGELKIIKGRTGGYPVSSLSYEERAQNLFVHYFKFAESWVNHEDWFDPATGLVLTRDLLDHDLSHIELTGSITNPKDFRNEIVNWTLRYQAINKGQMPPWHAYNKMRLLIEKNL